MKILSHRRVRRHHLTLIEMLVAMTALVLIMAFLIELIASINKLSYAQRSQTDLYEQQRLFFDVLSRDLQGMVASDAPEAEIRFNFPASYAGAWVTSSGIGLQNSDQKTLMEVCYVHDTDSTVYRYYTSESAGAAKYDFLGNPVGTWATIPGSWEDSSVVITSVKTFTMAPYLDDGTAWTSASDTAVPAYVEVEIEMYDPRIQGVGADEEVEKLLKKFNKTIYLKRGY